MVIDAVFIFYLNFILLFQAPLPQPFSSSFNFCLLLLSAWLIFLRVIIFFFLMLTLIKHPGGGHALYFRMATRQIW
jgi:hypothetical protein